MFNEAWKYQTMPKDWKKNFFFPIYKNEDQTVCDDNRARYLSSVSFEGYTSIIEQRKKLEDEQSDLKTKRQRISLIFVVCLGNMSQEHFSVMFKMPNNSRLIALRNSLDGKTSNISGKVQDVIIDKSGTEYSLPIRSSNWLRSDDLQLKMKKYVLSQLLINSRGRVSV